MAYDSKREVAVLMGGANYIDSYNDTWEWDGDTWSSRSADLPHRRSQHAMVFDTARNRIVLFGGAGYNEAFGDTWEWDGASWTLIPARGPAPRREHSMAFDSLRNVVVLFGGWYNYTPHFGDTWEWDGSGWNMRSNTGPSERSGHAMCFDSHRGVTVLFGGRNYGDTWEWDGNLWRQRPVSGPSPRRNHLMAYDAARRVIVLVGGHANPIWYDRETWEFNGESGTWTLRTSQGPAFPYGAQLAYDSRRRVCVLFTGEHPNPPWSVHRVWVWNGIRWTPNANLSPLSEHGHTMVYHTTRDTVVLSGGGGGDHFWEIRLPDLGDGDCDGVVGVQDLLLVLTGWGQCADCCGDVAPFGGDGVVNIEDLLLVINNWSK